MEDATWKFPVNTIINSIENKIENKTLNIDTKIADTFGHFSDFIGTHEINDWNPKVSVYFSAPTGSGKNYFIQNVLLPKIIDENRNEYGQVPSHLVLILSNRIALTRQTKIKIAKLLTSAVGDCKYELEMKTLYTVEGIDEQYIDFGAVTICTYHQMLKRGILDRWYKYIICDECHFFTSDSLFNNATYEMLQEIVNKGQNSVRIYMSATPEVVMPIILLEEWKIANRNFVNNVDSNYWKNISGYEKQLRALRLQKLDAKKKEKKKLKQEIHQLQEYISAFDYSRMEELKKFTLNVKYYYMRRDYSYIDKIYEYRDKKELIEAIETSISKWLIFVSSEQEGEELKQDLAAKKIECKLMSRRTVDTAMQVNREYNYLVEKEIQKTRVLIATSIIDNGINITNVGEDDKNKVLNIAINVFDRTEFIQMLGRVRRTENDKISLYIKHHTTADVIKLLMQNAKALITRLQADLHSYYNDEIFDKKIFRLKQNNEMEYNECAIWELIGRMTPLLTFLKFNSKFNFVKFSTTKEEALREQIYTYYKYNGKDAEWSRHIVDLLESEYEFQKRNEYIKEDIENGEDVARYQYKMFTFTQWQYKKLVSQYYEDQLKQDYDFFVSNLSHKEKNRYIYELDSKQVKRTNYEMLKCLSETINFASKNLLLDMGKYKEINDKQIFYNNLAYCYKNTTTTKEKLRCLELPNAEVITLTVKKDEQELPETLEEFMKSHSLPEKEIENHFVNESKDVKKGFLQERGILKDTEQATEISNKYFKGMSLANVRTDKTLIPCELPYELKSYREQTTRYTYYIFVPKTS